MINFLDISIKAPVQIVQGLETRESHRKILPVREAATTVSFNYTSKEIPDIVGKRGLCVIDSLNLGEFICVNVSASKSSMNNQFDISVSLTESIPKQVNDISLKAI